MKAEQLPKADTLRSILEFNLSPEQKKAVDYFIKYIKEASSKNDILIEMDLNTWKEIQSNFKTIKDLKVKVEELNVLLSKHKRYINIHSRISKFFK